MDSIPLDVFEAAVQVAGETLHWKSSLRQLLRGAGVSQNGVLRYETLSKYQILRGVWSDLDNAGPRGRVVQRNIVQALANLDKPDPAADREAGTKALRELRRQAKPGSTDGAGVGVGRDSENALRAGRIGFV